MPGLFIHTPKETIFNELIPGRRKDSDILYMHTADSHIFYIAFSHQTFAFCSVFGPVCQIWFHLIL